MHQGHVNFLRCPVFFVPEIRKFSRGGALKGVNGRNGYVTVAPRALAALRAAC
jgi:hypothetical protein